MTALANDMPMVWSCWLQYSAMISKLHTIIQRFATPLKLQGRSILWDVLRGVVFSMLPPDFKACQMGEIWKFAALYFQSTLFHFTSNASFNVFSLLLKYNKLFNKVEHILLYVRDEQEHIGHRTQNKYVLVINRPGSFTRNLSQYYSQW